MNSWLRFLLIDLAWPIVVAVATIVVYDALVNEDYIDYNGDQP